MASRIEFYWHKNAKRLEGSEETQKLTKFLINVSNLKI